MFRRGAFALGVVFLAWSSGLVRAETAAEFYKNKSVDLYIGYSVGGGYDVYARLVSRYLSRYIPGNPNVVPRNMDGAGSIRLTNWMYQVAPKDGTAIGAISRGVPFDPLLDRPGLQFEAIKFSWIGSANDEVSMCVSWHTSGVATFEDLRRKEIVVGAAGAGSDDDQFPKVINGVMGTKFKVVSAYPGGNEVALAMERGEVDGRCGYSWSSIKSTKPDWLKDKKINLLAQLALEKHPDLPNVPLVGDFATTDEERQILKLVFARQRLGRPFLAPPGVPSERVDVLRKAFDQALADPDLLGEAQKAKLEIRPLSGSAVAQIVSDVYETTTPAVARRVAGLLN